MNTIALIFLCILTFNSCSTAIKTEDRPELREKKPVFIDERLSNSEMNPRSSHSINHLTNDPLQQQNLEKYAYELGLDPQKKLTESEKTEVLDRAELRQLERSLDSQKERWNYSRLLPLFQNDIEKINYLKIPTTEGRQAWVNRNNIWSRDKLNPAFDSVVQAQDISLGMTQDLVRKSWGEPIAVESSGNPIYKNERWKYTRQTASNNGYKNERRYVYFEGGRVVGWDTE